MEVKPMKPVKRRRPCRKCVCSVARLVGNVLCPTDGRICNYVGKKAKDDSIKVTAAEVERERQRLFADPVGYELETYLLSEPKLKPKTFLELSSVELLSVLESEPLLNPDVTGLSPELLSKLSEEK
ncbi:hypothetical protein ES703_53142 [subsurface metagenome]